MPKMVAADIAGQRFHRLVAVARVGTTRHQQAIWLCRCDCGRESRAVVQALRSGRQKSCGCWQTEIRGKSRYVHGHTRITPDGRKGIDEYRIWSGIISRCYNPKVKCFHNYGGRGIQMCDRWRWSFLAFLEDMGPRPSRNHSIDRKDNDGNYEPGNCRWATRSQQRRNSRQPLDVRGCKKVAALAAEGVELGVRGPETA